MKTHHPPSKRICTLLALTSLLAVPCAHAADGTWDTDADGNWSDTSNWTGGIVADGADFTATFDNVITGNRIVTLDSSRSIGNVSLLDTSHDLTINSNTLTFATTSGTPNINVAGGDNLELTINSVIAGSSGLSKTGGGEFRPRGLNTFTGGISISGGRISIANGTNEGSWLGDASNVLTFTGNAQLYNENSQFTMPQGITINGGVTARVTGAFGERTQVDGVLAGSGTLDVSGFSAGYDAEFRNTANTFTGPITVNSGDSVTAGFASLPDSPGATTIGLDSQSNNGARFEYMSLATTALVFNNRQFELIVNGNAGTNLGRQPGIVNNAPTANTMTINTDLLVTGTGTKKFFLTGGNTGDNTFAGAIPDGVAGADLTLYKDGGGKWILTGANTYEGDTIITNGTLAIDGAGQLGAGSVYPGNIITNSNPFSFDSTAATTVGGVISGPADLIKDGAGTLTLTNVNTYSGDTTVDGGTLSLGNGTDNTDIDDFSTLSVAAGATLNLNFASGSPDTVLTLNLGGSAAATGEWGATGSGAANESALITGTGRINNLGGDTTPLAVAFWDGGAVDLGSGDAASAGGSGTWNTSIKNWDYGTTHNAWLNTTAAEARFGGTPGTVTLDADMNIGILNLQATAGGSGYSIGSTTEDNTLTFGGSAEINATADSNSGRHDHRIRAGIAGSPEIYVRKRNNNGAFFALEPPSGVTQTVGKVTMDNSLSSNAQIRLGGASSGNVLDEFVWTGGNLNNQVQLRKQDSTSGGPDGSSWTVNQDINLSNPATGGEPGGDGRIYVDEGTLILSGTDNYLSHSFEVGSGGRAVVQGNWRIRDEREDFRVLSGGIVAPGASVGTATFNWHTDGNSVGQVDLRTGSTYEWEVGAANATDVIALTEPVGDAELVVASGTTLEVIDAGGSPSPSDQLTVFTTASGVVTPSAATLNANMSIDLSGTTWTGPGTWGETTDGSGNTTLYITGIDSGGGGGSVFDTWATSNGVPTGSEAVDSDTGGLNNLGEFGLGGDPTDGNDDGSLLHAFSGDVAGGAEEEGILTILVRSGASFSPSGNDQVSAAIDGIVYTVAGDSTIPVASGSVVTGTAAVTTGLPAAPAGYEYASFYISGPEGYFTVTVAPE